MIWGIGMLAVLFLSVIFLYNGIVHAQIKVEEAKSGIDVALAKRYALLTNMQESVKGYVKHESAVFEKITEIRHSMSVSELASVNEQMNQIQNRLIALSESYPDLKASELFHEFNEAIVDCEEHLQAARRFYNSNVALYNEKLVLFPTNLMANLMKKEREEFFVAEDHEKQSVLSEF